MGMIEWMIALLAALTIVVVFLLWQVNELCSRLDRSLRIMMCRDDKNVWYEIDLFGDDSEDEDE